MSLTKQLQKALGTTKADDAEEIRKKVQRILDGLDFEGYDGFVEIMRAELEALFTDGTSEAAAQVGYSMTTDALTLANKAAVEYARDRSAEMVGMKWDGEKLVPNPNSEWAITEGTREMLRRMTEDAMAEGYSNDRLADAMKDLYAFSDERAETIARTETARADVQGNLEGYRAAGVQQKRWLTAPSCCDLCQEMNDQTVGIDDSFDDPEGGAADDAPLHPNCRCDVLPVLTETNSEEEPA